MCRLLGAVSTNPVSLQDLFHAELEPFRAMSEVHCDGWGAAYWDPLDDMCSEKSTEPALGSSQFDRLVRAERGDSALIHLRKASPEMATVPRNTHPFIAGSIAFAHNGYAHPNRALDALLDGVGADAPIGDTDSERYFQLVLALMRDMDAVEALDKATSLIAKETEYISLNCLMMTHDALYAAECWDPEAVAAKGDDPDTFTLRYRPQPGSVIVASSGWAQAAPQWETLSNGQLLEIRRGDLRTRVHRLHTGHVSAA